MVKLAVVKARNAALCTKPLVAVFVGGNSNIGAAAIKCLARTHGTTGNGLRAYIIGRNASAAASVIADCQTSCPAGQFFFIQAGNLALMKEVDAVCGTLVEREKKEAEARGEVARIDMLVLSQANFQPWEPRQETSEGLDTFMSLLFYSRARFITQLLPLLLSSSSRAHIISVFGPGRDSAFIPSDVSLRDPKNYGFMSSGSHAAYLKTFFFEYLAEKYPGKLSLTHYFPGLVVSGAMEDRSFPLWFKVAFKVCKPFLDWSPSTLKGEESGERTLFCADGERFPARWEEGDGVKGEKGMKEGVAEASDGKRGGGAYRVNWNGEGVSCGKQYGKMREEGWKEKMVAHTSKAWTDIEERGRFEG